MSEFAAGMDVHACVKADIILNAGETVAVPTGFSMAIPHGYEAQIRPRSGLAMRHSIGIINSPGTIDSDFRGEVKILLTNFSKKSFTIKRGERIAQMVVCPVMRVEWDEVTELPESKRGAGGFGHTGK